MRDAQDRCFIEGSADDLHGERQAYPIKSGADGNRRVAGYVENRGQVWPWKKMGRFVRAHFRRRTVGGKRHHGVIASESRLHLSDQLAALTLSLDVVDRPDEPAGDGAKAQIGAVIVKSFEQILFVDGKKFRLGNNHLTVVVIFQFSESHFLEHRAKSRKFL